MVKPQGRVVTTTVRLPERAWSKLRELADRRVLEGRGRSSASAVVADLVEKAAALQRRRAA